MEFKDGKSLWESYKSAEGKPLPVEDFKASLEVNKGASEWVLTKKYTDAEEWARKDGKVQGVLLNKDDGFFLVEEAYGKLLDKLEGTRGF